MCGRWVCFAPPEQGQEQHLLSDMRIVLGDEEQMATAGIDKHKLDKSPWADIRGKPFNDRQLAVRLRPY